MDAAMKLALSLADYDDILDPEMVYSLIALTSFHNQVIPLSLCPHCPSPPLTQRFTDSS